MIPPTASKPRARARALFLDIGGVLATNGWDRNIRKKAASHFNIELADFEERHHLTFDTLEEGKLSLDEYLLRVVFHEDRPFTREAFKQFIFDHSQANPEMIDLVRRLKIIHGLKVAVLSNESRELCAHRIGKFGLDTFVDLFIVSCFFHLRKPDADFYRLALDVAQVSPLSAVYVEDRLMFVEVARTLGIESIHHTSFESTKEALGALGLTDHAGAEPA